MWMGVLLAASVAWAVDTDADGWDDDVVHPDATVPASVILGDGAYVDAYASIGEGTVLGDGCVVGVRATIGARATLANNVIVSRNADIGDDVVVGAGSVFGRSVGIGRFASIGTNTAIGYGAQLAPASWVGDHVTLGTLVELEMGSTVNAYSVIARSTTVGAHSRIGTDSHPAIVGPTVTIGERVTIDGRVRVRKEVTLGDDVQLGDATRVGRGVTVGNSGRLANDVLLEANVIVEPCANVGPSTRIVRGSTHAATCTPATLIDRGAGVHGWSDGHPATSCEDYRRPPDTVARSYGGYAGSGIYRLTLDGSDIDVYCDMLTDGGGWTLLARFSQPNNVASLSQTTYDALVADAGWILGDAPAPTSPTSTYLDVDITSLDWAEHLGRPGFPHTLRQRFFRNNGASASDLPTDYRYDFVYNGHVVQDTVPSAHIASLGVWPLSNRVVLQDASTITWDTPAGGTLSFWLPFTNATAETDLRYTGCNGFSFDTVKCDAHTSPATRRFGNAGIIGDQADNADPGAGWAPHFNPEGTHDVVWVHQSVVLYGMSGQPMTLQYWLR